MNKYYYSLVIFALILFSANGQSNVWIQINKETRNWAEKNLSKCENISIKKSDSELKCYKKLLMLKISFFSKASDKKLNRLLNNVKLAVKIYPGSAIISSIYASTIMYEGSSNVNRSIKTLIPFLQEENNTPYVYLSMGHIFYGLRVNYYNKRPQNGTDKISQLLGCYKRPHEAYQKIILLEQYWLSKTCLNIKDKKFNEKILKARSFIANKNINEILIVWKALLKNLYKIDKGAIEREIYEELNSD
jgi:hypothetical protein